MRYRLLSGLLILSAAIPNAHASSALTLVKDGQPQATIVIAKDATRAAQFAADELQWHIKLITRATLPIARDDAAVTGNLVLIGDSVKTRALGIQTSDLKGQEYLVQFFPGALVLIGRDKDDHGQVAYWDRWDDGYDPATEPALKEKGCAHYTFPGLFDERGSVNAVYDFLERDCGVRWFRPAEFGMVYPQEKTLRVRGRTIRRSPGVRYMLPGGLGVHTQNYDCSIGLFPSDPTLYEQCMGLIYADLRRRCQERGGSYIEARRREGDLFLLRSRCGGEPYSCCHSITSFYPRFWEKDENWERFTGNPLFVEKRPQYFAQGYQGRPPQLCYTNPDVITQVVADANNFFDHQGPNLPLQNSAGNYFAVVPDDNTGWCKCARCQAELTATNSVHFSNGRASNYIFGFVNQVARAVRQTHPDKWIATLAYSDYAFPPTFKLEPNVTVQMCLASRNNWCPKFAKNDERMVQAWAGQHVPLYLWLYYCFPTEMSDHNAWHCFPGFFGHAAAREIKSYLKAGARGVFFNGLAQDVDMYLTYRLFDDPSLNADAVLNEYGKRFYGHAAAPMKQLYLAIEKTYSDSRNYPPDIAAGKKESHQTEAIAWDWLGTPQRMAQFAKLMDQARAAAQTDLEKRRVEVFNESIWQYMVQGRRLHLALKQYREHPPAIPTAVVVPRLPGPVPAGDPTKVDWSAAARMDNWHTIWAEPCAKHLELRAAHDGVNLYISLVDQVAPGTLSCQPGWESQWVAGQSFRTLIGDYWRVLVSRKGGPCYEHPEFAALLVPPTGNPVASWLAHAKVVSDVSDTRRWTVNIALPLQDLLPGGVEPGCSFGINVVRHTPAGEAYSWLPMFADITDVGSLGRFDLDRDPQLAVKPATAQAAIPKVDKMEIARETVDFSQLDMATDDLLQGKPFVVETPGALVASSFKNPHSILTDAQTPTAPTQDLFLQGAAAVAVAWELGPSPPAGRQLRQIKLYASAGDGCRRTIAVRFSVRDATTKAWRDVTATIDDTITGGLNDFRRVTVTFPAGSVVNFDAIRMTDSCGEEKKATPRLVEVDVIGATAER